MSINTFIKTIIIIPRMIFYSSKVRTLINKEKYDKAYFYLNKLDNLYVENKFSTRYIYRLHLNFLTEAFSNSIKIIQVLNNLLLDNDIETLYEKKFIYSLEYLELLLNDDKKANDVLKKIDGLFFNYSNVELYMRERFPLFTQKILKEIFFESNYYKDFSKEKLDSIIACFPKEASGEIKKYKGK